jgi:hypothetical protein
MSTKTTTHKPRPLYRMARVDPYDLASAAPDVEIREGDTVFLARVSHPNHHSLDYTAASLVPHRTNLSREEKEHGDLGSDNTANRTATGRAVVVEVARWVDEHTVLGHPRVEGFLSIRVRLDDNAPATFEVVDLEPGSLYNPRLALVRIGE